jgi:hypothetical protein
MNHYMMYRYNGNGYLLPDAEVLLSFCLASPPKAGDFSLSSANLIISSLEFCLFMFLLLKSGELLNILNTGKKIRQPAKCNISAGLPILP